jgi:transposase
MRGRSLQIAWQAEDTDEALKAAYRAEPNGLVRTRLHGLWLLRSGWSLRLVAELLGTHYRSVQRWVAWYRQGGLRAVQGHRMGGVGQPSFLTAKAQAEIAEVVASGRFHTAAEIRDWIAEHFQVSYTVGGVYSLLARLQCNPKVPRPINPKATLDEQEAWKKGDFVTPLPRPASR